MEDNTADTLYPELTGPERYSAGVGGERAIRESKVNLRTPDNYTIKDFENDEIVLSSFETLTDYLAEVQGVGSYLVDQAATGQTDDPTEYMRDLEYRLGAPLALANALKDAPEHVKQAFRVMKARWSNAEVSGFGETMQAVGDIGADVVFNPENLLTLGGILSGTTNFGASSAASIAARKSAQYAAGRTLMNAVRATSAAAAKNPLTASTLIGSTYGTAGTHAMQELDLAADIRDEYSVGETALGTVIGGAAGFGLYKAGSAIANKYFKNGNASSKELSVSEASEAFDEALEGDFIPASGGTLVDEAARLSGETTTVKGVNDIDEQLDDVINKFAEDLGGGEKTQKEIRAIIRAAADAEETVEGQTNRIKQGLYQLSANLSGNFFGKAAGVLSPIVKFSGTARQLQQKLSHEFGIDYGVQKDVVEKDLSEVQREVTGKINERFRSIVNHLSLSEIDTKLATDINDALSKSMRSEKPIYHDQFSKEVNEAITISATEIKALYAEMGDALNDIGVIDKLVENYIPRMWSRSAVEKNPNKLVDLFVTKAGMSKAEAKRTVANMLDVKNQVDSGTSSGYFFSAKRKINTIGNDSDFEEFLNSDVLGALHAYTYQYGKSIAKHRVLGVRNADEFNKFYINRIEKELADKGETMTPKMRRQIENLYRTATGEGVDRYGRGAQTAVDAYSFTNRVALLGLATLSSLTEVFINISKAGVVNSIKGFGEALSMSHKKITKDMQKKLMDENGLTANEALAEMRNFSIHVDQALAQVGDRLAGDELVSEGLQTASNKFFRITLLDQWTKFVQNVSFSSGKNLINENIQKLATRYPNRVLDGDGEVLAGELAELGIDWQKAVDWHNAGAKLDDDFYKSDFLGGAARYTNGVILQPTALSGVKPLLFSNPKTAVLFQLLSYPAAFTNTILKGATKSLIKAPKRNAPKILAAGAIMTGMARWTNYVRTGGENERGKTEFEITKEAIARWGGNGLLLDSLKRAQTAAKYSKSNLAYATLPFGPAASDGLSLIQQGIIPTVGYKIPLVSGTYFGKQILGEDYVKNYRRNLKKVQNDVFGGFIPEFEKAQPIDKYNKGGVVLATKAIDALMGKKTPKPEDGFTYGNIISEKLLQITDGKIDSKLIDEAAQKIDSDISAANATGEIKFNDFDLEELKEANLINVMESSPEKSSKASKLAEERRIYDEPNAVRRERLMFEIQEEAGFSPDHIKAIETIIDLDTNAQNPQIAAMVMNPEIMSIKAMNKKLSIDLTAAEKEAAKKVKFDEKSLDYLHNILNKELKTSFPMLSDKGAFEVARDAMLKLASKNEINFEKFKAPKMDSPRTQRNVLSPEQRKDAQIKFTADSENKDLVYRVVSSYQDADFNVSFLFPRETGTHVGSKGNIDMIMVRDMANELSNNDPAKTEKLMRQFVGVNAKPKPNAYNNFFNFVSQQIGKDGASIRPYTVEQGYINVKKPLVVEDDMGSWRVESILLDFNDSAQKVKDAIKANGVEITNKINKQFDKFYERAVELQPFINQKSYDNVLQKVETDMKRAELNLDFQSFLKELGFDSVKYRNTAEPSYQGESPYSYILFEPEQFKSVASQAFDSSDRRSGFSIGGVVAKAFAPKLASGFYSPAHKAALEIQGVKPKAGQSFINEMKKKGVSDEELDYTGITERFGNNKPVTKEEVLRHFDEQDFDLEVQTGRVRHKENYDNVSDDMLLDDAEDLMDADERAFWEWAEENYPYEVDAFDDLTGEGAEAFEEWYTTRFSEFQNKVGLSDFDANPVHLNYSFDGQNTQNYRELVFTLPQKFRKTDVDYEHQHFKGVKNPLLHIRLADITPTAKADKAEKVLLIDEIQSDASQAISSGVDRYTVAQSKRYNELMARHTELGLEISELTKAQNKDVNIKRLQELKKEREGMADEIMDLGIERGMGVPDLPYMNERRWGLQGIRKAMMVAAEEGYDRVALVTGEMQAIRNEKMGMVDEVIIFSRQNLRDGSPAGFAVQGRRPDSEVSDFILNFDTMEELQAKLPKIIGEKNAKDILASTPTSDGDYVLKRDMKFREGGQKFFDFYDKTLIKHLNNKFAKKYGVEITKEMYDKGDGTVELPTIKLTEEMREDILKGMPMFAEGGYVIQQGDTLTKIAEEQGMTVQEIADINNIKNVDLIYAGDTLSFEKPIQSAISQQAEIVAKSEPIELPTTEMFDGAVEATKELGETVKETAENVSKNVQSTVSETINKTTAALRRILGSKKDVSEKPEVEVKEPPKKSFRERLAALKLPSFGGQGRTAENMSGALRKEESDLSGFKNFIDGVLSADFSSEGRVAQNTAGTTGDTGGMEQIGEIADTVAEKTGEFVDTAKEASMKGMVFVGNVGSSIAQKTGELVDTVKEEIVTLKEETIPPILRETKRKLRAGVNILPENAVQFTRYMLGNKLGLDMEVPDVRVEGFGTKQQDVLRTAIENAMARGSTSVQYRDYPLMRDGTPPEEFYRGQREDQDLVDLALTSLTDPSFEMFTTVGAFNFKDLGDGKYQVLPDKYDFDSAKSDRTKDAKDKYGELVHAAQDVSDDPEKQFTFNISGVLM